MPRYRVAAVAALTIPALLVPATGGEAQKEDTYRAQLTCKTRHTDAGGARAAQMGADYFILRVLVWQILGGGASAARQVPADGVKVITKVRDLTTEDGNNVLDAKETDRTNDDGVAKNRHEFNNFGNYRAKATVKVDGDVVATDSLEAGVYDRESGRCEPAIGAG
jgi:hypothetical protein